jgi:predicted NAD/FAD-binding protein
MKIAVVGSGIAGLVAAYRLDPHHEVTLYEANDYLGGHTRSVTVPTADGPLSLDVGFIVYNERTYPRFSRLLSELGVESQPTSMSFSVCDERAGLEYNGRNLRTLFAQKRNLLRPKFLKMLADVLRFNRLARLHCEQQVGETTVAQFLRQHRLEGWFASRYLLPMGSAIWSCPIGRFAEFPIGFICEFFRNHGLLDLRDRPQWRVVRGGSRTYVDALAQRLRGRILLRSPVARVRRFADRAMVETRQGERVDYDHAVLACHADQSLRILGDDATPCEREVLSSFPYERSRAVLHTDAGLLPRRRAAWASWNYRLRDGRTDRPASVTYDLNILQNLRTPTTYCVTLNDDRIDPSRRIAEFDFEHPVFSPSRRAAQARHGELLNFRRTSYCGAYWGNGFHEDGVASAVRVADAIEAAVAAGSHPRREAVA